MSIPSETPSPSSEKKARLMLFYERLLPVIDGLADRLRLILIIGLLAAVWIIVWLFQLRHYSLPVTAVTGFLLLMPLLILGRFWWALEELKDLPAIADRMIGDGKQELQESVQNFREGKVQKLNFFSAGKSLWSLRGLASETMELMGSYLSIATLVNPLMLVLAVLSILAVGILAAAGVVLVFLSIL